MNKLNILGTIKNYIPQTVLWILLFSSCNLIKTIHLLKQGDIAITHFKEEIPFDFRVGLIIIKVIIDGKTYDFIFDTGATNAVSLELAEKINLRTESQQKAVDFEGKAEEIGFATLKKLTIGQVDFNNTACAIIDLTKVPEIKCLKVDGLIGANLMRKAKWQIDYLKKLIVFSDNIDSLHIPTNTPTISFKPELSGTPVFKGEINKIGTSKNIFDTGSSGNILLTKSDMTKLMEKDNGLQRVRIVGSTTGGLYGWKIDTTYVAQIPLIKSGTLNIVNSKVNFKKTDKGNFGSDFLKDYIVTFDWESNKIWFQEQPHEQNNDWKSFGFGQFVRDGKMIICYLYDNSPAQLNGLKLNDQIVSVNSINYNSIDSEGFCDMFINQYSWKNTDTLNLVIRSINEERKVTLIRKKVFEN